MHGGAPENGFGRMKSNIGKQSDRQQNSEGHQARLAKVEGVNQNVGLRANEIGSGPIGG